jgi:hypothetical protein
VSKFSCRSEVVQTAWAAVERAVLHEAKEAFLYKGERIMNPHFDVDELAVFAGNPGNEEVRAPNQTPPKKERVFDPFDPLDLMGANR